MDLAYEKKLLRKEAKEFRLTISKNVFMQVSEQIHDKLFLISEFSDADAILIYASLPGEIETLTLIEQLLTEGKKVYCPHTEGTIMNFYRIDSLKDLSEGHFHVLEPSPSEDKKFLPNHTKSFCVILPGLMFDKRGNRLGYGKGFYDKYLSSLSSGIHLTKIALSYEDMVKDTIPFEATDYKADYIITEKNIYCIQEANPCTLQN